MNIYDIITKKKRGEILTTEEIRYAVFGYTKGDIPDYQISALLMAIYFRGMTDEETVDLTEAITASGDTLDLSVFQNLTVDKHSSGGVGDKTTLIVAPIAASLGCKVAKMTGRGLGHTGGTADKLESIRGFKTSLSEADFMSQVEKIGIAVIAQNADLAPADKKIYALRDVTATVDSIPLIVSSIMGKKIAAGSKNIILDVKYGSGSFMKTADDAEILAEKMVKIGKSCGRNTVALITNMNQPLGYAVGNALEVKEAIEVLKGDLKNDLYELCVALAANMVSQTHKTPIKDAEEAVRKSIGSGTAYKKFLEWISAQGADASIVDSEDFFEKAKYSLPIYAQKAGYITEIDTEAVGLTALALGAGRAKKEDVIDYAAGIIIEKKLCDEVLEGEKIATLYTNDESALSSAKARYLNAIKIESTQANASPIIHKIIR